MPSRSKRITRITPRQVIDHLMDLIASFPEYLENLPEKVTTRVYWESILAPDSYRGEGVMDTLRELPAFTTLSPKGKGRAAWIRAFQSDLVGPAGLRDMLRYIMSAADVRQAPRPRIVSWRDAYGKDEKVQRIRPIEHHDYIPNPHRGTTTFQRFQGDPTYHTMISADTYGPKVFKKVRRITDNVKYIPRTTLTYCRWPWQWFEPRQGVYDWTIMDGTLRTAAERGQNAQIRFQPYSMRIDTAKNPPQAKRYPPEISVNVPDWYWDTGAAWVEQGAKGRNEPDSNDPLYLQHFGAFIRAFAARYDGHPTLESIDIAYGGFWGESGGNCTLETAEKLTDIYIDSFPRTQLLGMLGTPACNRAVARGYRLGYRADCFGDLRESLVREVPRHAAWNHTYDEYVRNIHKCGLTDAWKTAPVTMETCGNVATWNSLGYDLDRVIEEGYRYHTSVFMPKSVFFPERTLEKLAVFDRRIGYRYALRQLMLPLEVARGAEFTACGYIDNVGCAPIYRPYALALRLTQGKTVRVVRFASDLRTWLPGHTYLEQSFRLPEEFQRGEVKVGLAIVDADDRPRVWLAISGALDEGWHPLTSLDAIS